MELPRWHLEHLGKLYPIYRADIEGVEYTYTGEFNFVHEEDASMYTMKFGMKRHSKKIEHMLEREASYDIMEKYKVRFDPNGM